jgi:hypothetical protein
MESKLQAKNQELTEQLAECLGRITVLSGVEAQNGLLRKRIEDLIQENHRLADIILDKEEKTQ